MNRDLSATSIHNASWAGRGALAIYVIVLLYASLYPFVGWRIPEAFTLLIWPRYSGAFDIGLNVVAYLPLGALLAARARRRLGSIRVVGAVLVRIGAQCVTLAFALSLLLELLQALLPTRVSSPLDLAANTLGAALGAGAMLIAPGRALLAQAERWRRRHFAAEPETDWGILLLVLWLFAQMNPAIPFFEAGNFLNPLSPALRPDPYDARILLPQASAIALNVAGFALFVSLLLQPHARTVLSVLMLLSLGLAAKLAMAALMLKAPQLIDWLGPATVIGLGAGLLLFGALKNIGYRWRAFGATLCVFAGALMAKLTSIYSALDEMLRLFDWPHGHLVNFASLTRWVHEAWPFTAFLFLAVVFVYHSAHKMAAQPDRTLP